MRENVLETWIFAKQITIRDSRDRSLSLHLMSIPIISVENGGRHDENRNDDAYERHESIVAYHWGEFNLFFLLFLDGRIALLVNVTSPKWQTQDGNRHYRHRLRTSGASPVLRRCDRYLQTPPSRHALQTTLHFNAEAVCRPPAFSRMISSPPGCSSRNDPTS